MVTSSSSTSSAIDAVARGLGSDAHAGAASEAHCLDDVLRGLCCQDGSGAHRDGDVPGRDEGVVRLVTRDGDRAEW